MTPDVVFSYIVRASAFGDQIAHSRAHRVNNLCATAVVERDAQDHAGVALSPLDGLLELASDAVAQRVGATDGLEAYVLPVNLFEFETQVALEHAHQRVNFQPRSLPVLRREGVERERSESEARARVHGCADGLDAGAVARYARLAAARRPATVAVHDDGHVSRQARPVHLRQQRLVARPSFDYVGKVGEHPGSLPERTDRSAYQTVTLPPQLNRKPLQSAKLKVESSKLQGS